TDSSSSASSYSATRSFVVATTPPSFSSAAIDGMSLEVRFSKPLDGGQTLANAIFTVKKNGVAQTLTGTPSIAGSSVTLALASAANHNDTVTVAYTKPGSAPWVQDEVANPTATFGAQSVTNATGNVAPVVDS